MAIKKLSADQKFERSTLVNAKAELVKVLRTAKVHKDDPVRYVVDWTFDFTDVSRAELLELAIASLVIRAQTKFRDTTDAGRNAFGERMFVVREMLDEKPHRGPVDPTQGALRNVAKMSAAEREAFIKMLKN